MTNHKGTYWETQIVRYLNDRGFATERRAKTGARDRGDISGLRGIVIEAKNVRGYDLAGWIKQAEVERQNDEARIGVVWAHAVGKGSPGDGYVILTGDMFVELLDSGGWR